MDDEQIMEDDDYLYIQAARRKAQRLIPTRTYKAPVTVGRRKYVPNPGGWGDQYTAMLAKKGESHQPLPTSAPDPVKMKIGGARKTYAVQMALLSVVVVTTLLSSTH